MEAILSVVEVEPESMVDVRDGLAPGFYVQLKLADPTEPTLRLVGPFETADEAIETANVCANDAAQLQALFDHDPPRLH